MYSYQVTNWSGLTHQLYVPTNGLITKRFAPLDRPTCERAAGLQSIFQHYEIPSDFLSQRLQSVTHSFGALSEQNSHSMLPHPIHQFSSIFFFWVCSPHLFFAERDLTFAYPHPTSPPREKKNQLRGSIFYAKTSRSRDPRVWNRELWIRAGRSIAMEIGYGFAPASSWNGTTVTIEIWRPRRLSYSVLRWNYALALKGYAWIQTGKSRW